MACTEQMLRHKSLLCLLAFAAYTTHSRWLWSRQPGFVGFYRQAGRTCTGRSLHVLHASPAIDDPYFKLGIPYGTKDEALVRTAFRRLAKIYHPDVPGTGSVDAFQDLQVAVAHVLKAAGSTDVTIDVADLFTAKRTAFAPKRESKWAPPTDGHSPKIDADAAKNFGASVGPGLDSDRVNVQTVLARKSKDVRKQTALPGVPRPASAETLATITEILARGMGMQVSQVYAEFPLQLLLPMEGDNNIGSQSVADTLLELEETFNIELVTIMVRTWVRSKLPRTATTVQALADFIEGKAVSGEQPLPPEQQQQLQQKEQQQQQMLQQQEQMQKQQRQQQQQREQQQREQIQREKQQRQQQVMQQQREREQKLRQEQEQAYQLQMQESRAREEQQQQQQQRSQQQPRPATVSNEEALPHPWEKQWSDEHRLHFYWNPTTSEAVWDRAEIPQAVRQTEAPSSSPWEKKWSEEHQLHYYWNAGTGESSWEQPSR